MKNDKYLQRCKRLHALRAAEALKLEVVAFQEGADSPLWEHARHVRHEAMDYVQIRHTACVRPKLWRVCRRTGRTLQTKDAVYLMNVGVIAREALTETEKRHSNYCDAL